MRFAVLLVASLAIACQSQPPAADTDPPAKNTPGEGSAVEPQAAAPTQAAPKPSVDPAGPDYAGDIDRICNAETRSGASEMEEGARPVTVAQWLGANIQTGEGRQFLVTLAKTRPADKSKMLLAESTKVGLKACALAKAWSGGGQSTL